MEYVFPLPEQQVSLKLFQGVAPGSPKVSNLILTSQGVAVSGRKRYNIGVRGQHPHRLNLMFPETWQFQDLADAAHIGTIEVPVAEGAYAPLF